MVEPWFQVLRIDPPVQLALVLLRRRIRSVDLHLAARSVENDRNW